MITLSKKKRMMASIKITKKVMKTRLKSNYAEITFSMSKNIIIKD